MFQSTSSSSTFSGLMASQTVRDSFGGTEFTIRLGRLANQRGSSASGAKRQANTRLLAAFCCPNLARFREVVRRY